MPKLRIAISGGGIASLCLARGLSAYSQWEVKIFEASSVLRDEGAAIGLGSNAQQALELISSDLRQALDEAGGVKMNPSVRLMMGTGPDSGQLIGDIQPSVKQIVVHRGSFWRALRRLIPKDSIEMGKKLHTIEGNFPNDSESLRLRFEGGSFHECDALVGCDGINSITRQEILGADHPAAKPRYTNGYNHRVVVPITTAREAFGEDYCALKTQHGWIGENGFLLTDHIDNGDSMQVIAGWSKGEVWPHEAPFVEWSKDRLKRDLAEWGEIGRAMIKIFDAQPKLYAAGGRTHLDTPTYSKGRICIAGDAAQAFPPFQGAGAGQAIEDAMILVSVLGCCTGEEEIEEALRVYDKIRRPRRKDVAESSRKAGLLFTGRAPGIGLDVGKIREELKDWGRNIYEYDLLEARREAVRRMEGAVARRVGGKGREGKGRSGPN